MRNPRSWPGIAVFVLLLCGVVDVATKRTGFVSQSTAPTATSAAPVTPAPDRPSVAPRTIKPTEKAEEAQEAEDTEPTEEPVPPAALERVDVPEPGATAPDVYDLLEQKDWPKPQTSEEWGRVIPRLDPDKELPPWVTLRPALPPLPELPPLPPVDDLPSGDSGRVVELEEDPSPTVHATRTGERYHRAGCRYLRLSDIPMSLDRAEARGLTPCRVCRP